MNMKNIYTYDQKLIKRKSGAKEKEKEKEKDKN